jgi:hypothetical protein
MRGLLGDGGSIAQGAMLDKNFLSETGAKRLMTFFVARDGGGARVPVAFSLPIVRLKFSALASTGVAYMFSLPAAFCPKVFNATRRE